VQEARCEEGKRVVALSDCGLSSVGEDKGSEKRKERRRRVLLCSIMNGNQ